MLLPADINIWSRKLTRTNADTRRLMAPEMRFVRITKAKAKSDRINNDKLRI
jgi:hypothetical protein